MLRYSKIMLGNCCNIWQIFGPPSFLQLWVATNEWSGSRTDPTIPFWLLLSFFLQHYHSILYFLPLQSPMVGRILDHVPGHTSIGRSQNFIHLVTGHTPGRINQNGTVCCRRQATAVKALTLHLVTVWWCCFRHSTSTFSKKNGVSFTKVALNLKYPLFYNG